MNSDDVQVSEDAQNEHGKGYQAGMEDLYELMRLWVVELNDLNPLTDGQWLIAERILNSAEKVVYYEFKKGK